MDQTAERNTPRYLINRVATVSVAVVIAIMLSSAYLRQSSVRTACQDDPACTQRAPQASDDSAGAGTVNPARLVHRLSASIAGGAVLLIALLAWVQRPRDRTDLAIALALLAVTSFLAALGRWSGAAATPLVTLGNIFGGMTLIALLCWLRLRTAPGAPTSVDIGRRLAMLPAIALALNFVAIGLGALMGGPAAAVGDGREDPVLLAHGMSAILVLVLTAVLAIHRATPASVRAPSLAAFCLAGMLGVAGWGSTQFGHPLALALAHNLFAALLLMSLLTATYRCARAIR
jgi:heme a synthase